MLHSSVRFRDSRNRCSWLNSCAHDAALSSRRHGKAFFHIIPSLSFAFICFSRRTTVYSFALSKSNNTAGSITRHLRLSSLILNPHRPCTLRLLAHLTLTQDTLRHSTDRGARRFSSLRRQTFFVHVLKLFFNFTTHVVRHDAALGVAFNNAAFCFHSIKERRTSTDCANCLRRHTRLSLILLS